MEQVTLDALTRRASLLALGVGGLAGLTTPRASHARKKGKKKDDRCKKQVAKCQAGVADLCLVAFGEDSLEECVALFGPCCSFLKTCAVDQAFACAVEVAQTI